MSLKELIARDIETVFLNVNDFCDNLTLQVANRKFNIIGSLQQNLVRNTSGTGGALQKATDVLYIKYPIDFLEDTSIVLSSGTRVTINNKPYTVVDVSDEMGLCTINLSTTTGR